MILAADISMKATGIAAGDGTVAPEVRVFSPAVKDREHADFMRWWSARVKEYEPSLIAVEAPFVGPGKPDAARVLYGLLGIAQGIAELRAVPVLLVNIGSWRAAFLNKGRFKDERDPVTGKTIKGRDVAKRACLRVCHSLAWEVGTDDNKADACGIWAFAHLNHGNNRAMLQHLKGRRAA